MNNKLHEIVLSIFSNLEKYGLKKNKNSDVLPQLKSVEKNKNSDMLPKLKSVVTEVISPG